MRWFIRSESRGAGRSSRREMLRIGSLGLGALTLPDLFRRQAEAGTTSEIRDRAVIHVFMGGGPSHIDMFDMKPDAPPEIRGEFRPIPTRAAGVSICEHLPHLAKVMDRVALVRSVSHSNPSHLPASHWMMTGYEPAVASRRNANPYCGAVVAKVKGANTAGMPAYVGIPRKQIFGGAGYLGAAYNPFTTESDPGAPDFRARNLRFPIEINATRLRQRQAILREVNQFHADAGDSRRVAGFDRFTSAAIDMVTRPVVQKAFDIDREPANVRDRYGRTSAGQRCLLARRLVEAGVTFVTVLSGGEWDTHTANFKTLKELSLPPVDRALSALIADLYDRGLDQKVLLLVSGEFGRTSTINKLAGRDHWPGAMSVLFSGGGTRVGQAIGKTDGRAMFPKTHAYSPGDVLATVYHFLGVDASREFPDESGRPFRILQEGRPIPELVS